GPGRAQAPRRPEALPPAHSARADPRPGRVVVAHARGVRPADHRARAAHAHPLARVRGRRRAARRYLPLGVRAVRGMTTHATHTSLGLDSRKMAFWAFIGSECLLFTSLISTYLVYKGRSVVGPYPHDILNIPFTSGSTFDLLMSSLTMVLALAAGAPGGMGGGHI